MTTATNPETGETAVLVGSEWKPVTNTATNDKGQKAYLVGNEWIVDDSATAQPAPAKTTSGYARGLRDPIDAGAQLLTNVLPQSIVDPVNKLNNWLADKTGLVGKLPEGGVDQQVREQEAQYQQQRANAGEEGFDWGRLAGNVLNPANIAIAAKIPQGATMLGKLGMGGLAGTTFGALQPATGDSPENFASEKALQALMGGVFGVGTSAAGQAGSWAWNQIKATHAMTNPAGRERIVKEAIRRWAGKDTPDVIGSLDDLKNYQHVPGSPVTSADVVATGNMRTAKTSDPRMFGRQIVAAQEGLTRSSDVTSDLASDAVKQQTARMKYLESLIPDEGAAISARDKATEALYKQANAALVPVTGKTQGYLLRIPPEVLRQANKAATINGEGFLVRGKLPSQLSGQQVHYIKMSLDDAINSKTNPGITATVQRNLSELKDDFLKHYENQNPAYGQARQTYREMSKPANQAQVLKAMKAELAKPGGGERGGAFMNVLGKGEAALLKRSTGMPRYQDGDIEKILTPEQLKGVAGISHELEREVTKNQILSKAVSHNAGKEAEAGMAQFPRVLEQNIVIANYFLGKAKEKIVPEMNQMAADILRDPLKFRDVLDAVPKNKTGELVKKITEAAKSARLQLPAASTTLEQRKK